MNDWLRNPRQLFDVSGKVAVVTGASGAFGALASKVLAGAGAKVVLAAGNKQALEATAAACRELGAEVATIARRPTTEDDCAAILDFALEQFGGLDILVVGSGLNDPCPIVDMPLERFEDVMDGNVTSTWLLCRAFGQRVIPRDTGGKVVLVSSARGKLGHPAGYSAYCASKAATDGLTRALGCEWGKHRITVNAIAPTVFRSPLTAWMFEDTEKARTVRDGFLARVPLGRLGEPEDLAGPLLFLCSRASDFHTGHTVYADGGYTAG
ncbi:SDR family NAD(P)-dependent oxidoreductase [Noviherbaspirillum denitrificans]|uniref:Oxidoreductase n=1 Tax=Noviherbaspirillum denitrificans TaxID=1968433 RepID=A0A254TDA2_9BURK|nr:SDR family oxidoreductase [Noviherbaspirillum denitrificans]OWW19292.1 oxidoreductase [Noviherbaspirillum denitrificans]